jgi:hypothetical protein
MAVCWEPPFHPPTRLRSNFLWRLTGCDRGVNDFLTTGVPSDPMIWGVSRMRRESKFSTWIRSGGKSTIVLVLNSLVDLEVKFSVVPERLLDSIDDDALASAVGRLNHYLPSDVSIDISSVDLTPIRDQLRSEVADRLTEIGVAVNPNDPVITSIIAQHAEIPNGFFQTEGLHVESYIWRSGGDSQVRATHAEYDGLVISWSDPPEGGHPGEGWNCRCTAEPIIDQPAYPRAQCAIS